MEIEKIEKKYEAINQDLKSVQEKFTVLREGKARLEATTEGIDQRKMDLTYMMKNELKIENINNLLNMSDIIENEKVPSVSEQEQKLEKRKKSREAMGSVNLRADIETEKSTVPEPWTAFTVFKANLLFCHFSCACICCHNQNNIAEIY